MSRSTVPAVASYDPISIVSRSEEATFTFASDSGLTVPSAPAQLPPSLTTPKLAWCQPEPTSPKPRS